MTKVSESDALRYQAAAVAHRACTGSEHDPLSGKLHGCCVVCGVAWPCETARVFLIGEELRDGKE